MTFDHPVFLCTVKNWGNKHSQNLTEFKYAVKAKSKEDLEKSSLIYNLIEKQFEVLSGSSITKHNGKYLCIENKTQVENHISNLDPSLQILNKTIPDVMFKHLSKGSLNICNSNSAQKRK